MIQTIVSLYRAAIAVIFVAGLAFSVAVIVSGVWGVVIGIASIGVLVMSVGISAVLLSINDHLLALRIAAIPASSNLQEKGVGRSPGLWLGTVAIIVAVIVTLYGSGQTFQADGPLPVETSPPPTLKMGSSVKEGCVPELAAKAGLKCREE